MPEAPALRHGKATLGYDELARATRDFAGGLVSLGLEAGERVAIYLEKRIETVVAKIGRAHV